MAYYFLDERIFAKRPNLTLYGKQSSYNENETTLLLSKEYLLQPKKLKHYEVLMNSSQRPVLLLFFLVLWRFCPGVFVSLFFGSCVTLTHQ